MTPVEIEVILKFWYAGEPHKEVWSMYQRRFIQALVHSGHLVDTGCGVIEANREALKPIVDALCAVPLSRTTWVLPEPDPQPEEPLREDEESDLLFTGVYPQEVKEAAYKLDPECWVSYSGKPRHHKRVMEVRRWASLRQAFSDHWRRKHS